ALIENGIANGGEIKLRSEVVGISKDDLENDVFKIKINDGEVIETKYIINAAGVYADKIHNMICEEEFKITPIRGEYYVIDKNQGKLFNNTVFQCPSKLGKGVLVTPTVHGNLIVGPNAETIID
ncbi:FAD-dependent oxidoreductase, partial [Clostridium perfringens]|nr:FAD-dependent oxidoreductase [Clostridium perfringens]